MEPAKSRVCVAARQTNLALAMPRDVLGLDPYQASAVSCAKRGAILAALLTLGAIGLTVYGLNGGGELYTYLGATSFGTSVLSFCLANRCARHTTPPTQSFPSVSPTGVPGTPHHPPTPAPRWQPL